MTTVNHTPRLGLAGALTAAGLLIAACGQGNPATAGNEQAVVDNEAGTLNAPPSDALGGATGQTPGYGQPGGVPSEAYSAPGSQPAGSEMPPPPGSN
ncbi:MAG: hypothetical protein Q8R71_01920 [Phenylobacterium sp.]|nr:hypothetical protein [Phenylobacterium sp.]